MIPGLIALDYGDQRTKMLIINSYLCAEYMEKKLTREMHWDNAIVKAK